MRFVAMVKATKESESGVMPTEQELAEMGAYNEELVKNGVMLAGEGFHPSSSGVRIQYGAGTPTVVNGPFAATGELVSGFWIIQTQSLDEAVEWLKRAPFRDGEVEIRQIFEAEDFGDEFTPELREQEERLRAQVAKNR
ncbi:MAG TPA: YciI family protein [Actinomycetota bacterium]|nr:YciI family protein [Actinomycetota bacterium]